MDCTYSPMCIEEYEEVYDFWRSIPGVRLNEADEQENINTYLLRNPAQSFVCKSGGQIIGTIMCGNDGRRAFIYHLAVSTKYRRHGIATKLVHLVIDAQKLLGITKCVLFILNENKLGKCFWTRMGFSTVQEAGTMAKNI